MTRPNLDNDVLDFLLKKRQQYPNLYFTLRDANSPLLAYGYWFNNCNTFQTYSNEMLSFSLWEGATPVSGSIINICLSTSELSIYLNEQTQESTLNHFFYNVSQIINGFEKKTDEYGVTWIKKISSNNWREQLDMFINDDKPIIDALLTRELKNNNSLGGLKNIEKINFEKNLTAVLHARTKLNLYPNEADYMSLQKITIRNIGHFESISMDLQARVICLIGENGSGKSTILRTIALGLTGVDVFRQDIDNPLLSNEDLAYWLRLESKKQEESSIKLTYKTGNAKSEHTNQINGATFSRELFLNQLDGDRFVNIQKNKFIVPILGFPQGGGQKRSPKLEKQNYPTPTELLPLIKNEAINQLSHFSEWIDGNYFAYLKEKKEDKLKQIKEVFRLISLIINGYEFDSEQSVRFVAVNRIEKNNRLITQIIVQTPEAPNGIPLELLSQGYNNLFYWIGGIVSRLSQINEYYLENEANNAKSAIYEMNGIILIDEIDTYLHPKWQRTILQVLSREFKNIQFIITTHSPLVLGNINPKEISFAIYSISKNQVELLDLDKFNPYGATSDRLLRMTMDTSERPLIIKKRIDEIFDNLTKITNKKELMDIEVQINQLKNDIDPYDLDVLRIENLFNLKKRLNGNHH